MKKRPADKAGLSLAGWRPGTPVSLALLTAIACLITLPFIFKAFHVDDTVFVWLGQQKLKDPLALGLPSHAYEGNFFPLYLDTHPPLLSSYLSLLIRICGGASEAGLHLGFVIFPVLAAVSIYFLARRFTGSALIAALLFLLTPGFVVMSQSVMTDVPSLALCLAAVASYIYALDHGGSRRLLAVTAVAASLAVLTTYQSFSLIPLLFLYAWLRRRFSWRELAPLAAALGVFAAVILYNYHVTGGPPKLSYSTGLNLAPAFLADKVLAAVSVVGGATIFPLLLAAGMLKGKKDYLFLGGVGAAILALFLARVANGQYTLAAALLQTVFYTVGILAIYRITSTGLDAALAEERTDSGRDDIFLALWFYGVLGYSLVLLPYASTRYLLPLFPPVILMFVRYARGVIGESGRWLRFGAATVVLTAAVSLSAAVADYQLSGLYRDFAADNAPPLTADGHRLWFAGEFGLRYYLEQAGGRYLTRDDNSPRPGDHVVLSKKLISSFVSSDLMSRLQLERTLDFGSDWPVRVQDPASLAGFYDQFHGNLPYSLASGPMEQISVYEVK
ncbi:MAG: ArnT family glycosyltransferase [Thermoleophilia bacterium]